MIASQPKCFANAGQCSNPATCETDDGAGNKVWACAHHLEEYEAWTELFASLTPEQRDALDKEISKHERANSSLPEGH